MPIINNRQLIKGIILLSGMLLIAACAEPPTPYSVVYEEEKAPEVITVKAAYGTSLRYSCVIPGSGRKSGLKIHRWKTHT
jgi:hypothetical protein